MDRKINSQKRIDRKTGDLSLGVMVSTRDKGGNDIYSSMRDVKSGDIVLHLTDNKAITGVSIASSAFREGQAAEGTDYTTHI